ncbi:hypothetical protein [Planktothricoides raciborskii]|uniref:hypothetical protein n=1 Tax=Planktothricoides raciborskii TaxID=132608 RepID=UPI001A7E4F91|nr:hypothetical protein [Planktothricoides raciborskii]
MLQYFTINQPLERKSGNNFIRGIISGFLHTIINCDIHRKNPVSLSPPLDSETGFLYRFHSRGDERIRPYIFTTETRFIFLG